MPTEAEAKTKWCPFARVVDWGDGSSGVAGNRSTIVPPPEALNRGARCIGSECMAWRWGAEVEVIFDFRRAKLRSNPKGEGCLLVASTPSRNRWERSWGDHRPGFCGLAEPSAAEVSP